MTNSAANAVFRFKHKNGGWRWLESAGKSFKTSNGELRWVIDSRDITRAKERGRADTEILSRKGVASKRNTPQGKK